MRFALFNELTDAQLKERGYVDKYRGAGVPIHLIGVEFSRERRSVVGFAVETIAAGVAGSGV